MLQRLKRSIDYRISRYHYRRLAANIERPAFSMEQLRAEGYYSQTGQDKWVVERLLPGNRDGVFVDIGANDGITFSNTYFLEKAGWTGLAVEPNPSIFEKLAKHRQCICIHGCIAPVSGKRTFRSIAGQPHMLSGLVDEYDPRNVTRIDREISLYGGEYTDIEVNCYNINELLERNGIFKIDYVSIDVEGAEYKILESIDFDRFEISIIGVENSYWNHRMPRLLVNRGFEFHSIVGSDEFYRNTKDRP